METGAVCPVREKGVSLNLLLQNCFEQTLS